MHSPTDPRTPGREIKITRQDHGWSIKIKDPNPETRHQPLTKQERTNVREEVRRAEHAGRAD